MYKICLLDLMFEYKSKTHWQWNTMTKNTITMFHMRKCLMTAIFHICRFYTIFTLLFCVRSIIYLVRKKGQTKINQQMIMLLNVTAHRQNGKQMKPFKCRKWNMMDIYGQSYELQFFIPRSSTRKSFDKSQFSSMIFQFL